MALVTPPRFVMKVPSPNTSTTGASTAGGSCRPEACVPHHTIEFEIEQDLPSLHFFPSKLQNMETRHKHRRRPVGHKPSSNSKVKTKAKPSSPTTDSSRVSASKEMVIPNPYARSSNGRNQVPIRDPTHTVTRREMVRLDPTVESHCRRRNSHQCSFTVYQY